MDTAEQTAVETTKQITRRRRSVEEKRRIVEETLRAGASVARVARRHAVNANQVFYWRKKYREGRLGKSRSQRPPTCGHLGHPVLIPAIAIPREYQQIASRDDIRALSTQ